MLCLLRVVISSTRSAVSSGAVADALTGERRLKVGGNGARLVGPELQDRASFRG